MTGSNHSIPRYLPKRKQRIDLPKVWTQLFLVALLAKAQTRKQPTCPSTGEWLNKIAAFFFNRIPLKKKEKKKKENKRKGTTDTYQHHG